MNCKGSWPSRFGRDPYMSLWDMSMPFSPWGKSTLVKSNLNLFRLSIIVSRGLSFANKNETSPVNWLPDTSKVVKFAWPNDLGMVPDNLFSNTWRVILDLNDPKLSGIEPISLFLQINYIIYQNPMWSLSLREKHVVPRNPL